MPPDFITTHTVEIVPLNESLLVDMPSKMWKVDSLLILETRSADNDAHFQILSATNGTYMGNFGNIERGNNELLDYQELQSMSLKRDCLPLTSRVNAY